VLISTLPFDEDIQNFVPPSHQEENMISDNHFEYLDDALFCNFGSEKLLEEPLDATYLSRKKHMKHSALRIKPRVMKRQWRSMPIERKTILDEAQHVEASFYFLFLDEDEVIQTCLPPAHEDEETISLDDTNDLVQDPFDMVDLHIDDFIQVGRRRWDVICFSIDRDPIYDIGGNISQADRVEFSSSEEWSSYVYDSEIWQPGDDMVIDLFFPFRMTYHNILKVSFSHPLVHTLLRMHICFMRNSNRCAQILRNTRTWPSQSNQRFILQGINIFILGIFPWRFTGEEAMLLYT
jgi:hypothetical protein